MVAKGLFSALTERTKNMKIFLLTAALLTATSAQAQPLQFEGTYNPDTPLQEYFAEEDQNYKKSIIYVFYNNESCYGCPQTIAELENIYNEYYKDDYSFFIINYEEDEEYNFAQAYKLSQPLEVVMVKIQDGASFGYEKLTGLQNRVSDPLSLSEYFRYRVNSFLGD